MRKHLLILTAATMLAAPLSAQITISTGTPTAGLAPLGLDSSQPFVATAFLQTFTAPNGAYFLNFVRGFIQAATGGGSSLKLTGSVYRFDTDHVVGPALITSSPFNGSDNTGPGFDELDFGDPSSAVGVPVTAGNVYALVLSAIDGLGSDPDPATITVGTVDDLYAGGSLFYTSDTDLSTATFSDIGFDAAFTATFGAPEPSEFVLLATGLCLVAGVVRRRRRNVSAEPPRAANA